MKIGNVEIKLGANEVVIGAVVVITIALMIVDEISNADMFKQGFGALIAWGAGYATGKGVGNDR